VSALRGHVADYLRLRRSLGYRLEREERLLGQFCSYAGAAGAVTVTSRLAIDWARQPAGAQPARWAQRLGVIRRFATWLQVLDPAAEIPPAGVFPSRRNRPAPYLWPPEQVRGLVAGARAVPTPLLAASLEALFGLLAVSGMRIGEAVALHRDDVSLDTAVITVREAKHGRERLVPLHPTAAAALRKYAAERDRVCPRPRSETFFLSSTGTALDRNGAGKQFRKITTAAGIRTAGCRPRIHDLRHAFAVTTLTRWVREGQGADASVALLSAYLGHVSPSDTYYYLSASPELMELAALRLASPAGQPR
jgi:integrase/recombinase XerD